jgi:hypothetical protein
MALTSTYAVIDALGLISSNIDLVSQWLLERGDNGLWVLRNGTGLYLSLPWGVDPNNGVPLTALDNRQEFEIIDSEQVEGAYKCDLSSIPPICYVAAKTHHIRI